MSSLTKFVSLCLFSSLCQAGLLENHQDGPVGNIRFNPFYIGVSGGYGSTTWNGLVPTEANKNEALSLSTPIEVQEGGGVWGVFAGYELTPTFALEANYMHYPDANIAFESFSLFSYSTNFEQTEFITHTEVANLMGKIMLFIPNTNVRVYSGAGVASVHRRDTLKDNWLLTPTFGVGLNYHFAKHVLGEIGANYTAGFGESNLNPSDSYFPFLYSVAFRLAYCF